MQIVLAKNNSPTIKINDVFLHSSYRPEQEARRFVEGQVPPDKNYTCILVCGELLGYIGRAVQKLHPTSKLLSIFSIARAELEQAQISVDASNSYFTNMDLDSFLSKNLTELDLLSLKVIIWPKSMEQVELAQSQVSQVQAHLRFLQKQLVTTAVFGRTWLRNLVINFMAIAKIYPLADLELEQRPILILASGPSLNKILGILKRRRSSFCLWALPSSLAFLRAHNIRADLVVSVDPGIFAQYHYKYILDQANSGGIRLASSLLARPKHPCQSALTLINQNSFFEQRILGAYGGLNIASLRENGTVAGTALQLALAHSKSEIIFAGLDQAYYDLQGHVQPQSFDDIYYPTKWGRLQSSYNKQFERMSQNGYRGSQAPWNWDESLEQYRSWFSSIEPNKRVFRLNPSGAAMANMNNISSSDLESLVLEARQAAASPRKAISLEAELGQDKRSYLYNKLEDMKHECSHNLQILYYLCTLQLKQDLTRTAGWQFSSRSIESAQLYLARMQDLLMSIPS